MLKVIISVLFIFQLNTVFAKERDLLSAAEKKKAIISGVLNPASISFNGKEIEQSNQSYQGLLLNDKEVKINEISGLKTFYENIETESIELSWLTHNLEKKNILKVEYPAIKEMYLKNNTMYFKFNEATTHATFDSQELDLKQPIYKVSSVKKLAQELHTLELSSAQNSSQIYNLDFRNQKNELLTTDSLILYTGDAPLSANERPQAIALGIRRQLPNNYSWELLMAYAKVEYDMGYSPGSSNHVMQGVVEAKARYGYNFNDTNSGDIDVKRVSLGLQIEEVGYVRESTWATNLDGYNDTKVKTIFFQGGWYLRWEPLQYNEYGFVLNFDFRLFSTQSNISSDNDLKYFGISYSF